MTARLQPPPRAASLAVPATAATLALRQVLAHARDPNTIEDLLFLERWELRPLPGTAAVLRVTQIRRANPDLAAAIRAEIAGLPKRWPPAAATGVPAA